MSLEPGERFEHTHLTESTTTLIEGSVDLVMGGERRALEVGVPVSIQAGISHLLINVGDTRASVECGHGVSLDIRRR